MMKASELRERAENVFPVERDMKRLHTEQKRLGFVKGFRAALEYCRNELLMHERKTITDADVHQVCNIEED